MAWRKTFETTEDGRFMFRPGGQFGRTYELPDKGAYDRARWITWGMTIVVFAFAIANFFHREPIITIVVALILLIAYFGWLSMARKGWKVAKDG